MNQTTNSGSLYSFHIEAEFWPKSHLNFYVCRIYVSIDFLHKSKYLLSIKIRQIWKQNKDFPLYAFPPWIFSSVLWFLVGKNTKISFEILKKKRKTYEFPQKNSLNHTWLNNQKKLQEIFHPIVHDLLNHFWQPQQISYLKDP